MSMIVRVLIFGQKLFQVHELIVQLFGHMLFYEHGRASIRSEARS